MMKFLMVLLSFCLITAVPASAQVYGIGGYGYGGYGYGYSAPATTVVAPIAPVVPQRLEHSGQYFDGDFSGFSDYLSSIQTQDPELYSALSPRVEEMKSRSSTAKWVGWGGAGLGAIVALSAFAVRVPDGYGYTTYDTGLAVGGCVVMLGALIAALVLEPGRGDLMGLVNEHNRLRPKSPLQIQLGLSGPNQNLPALEARWEVARF